MPYSLRPANIEDLKFVLELTRHEMEVIVKASWRPNTFHWGDWKDSAEKAIDDPYENILIVESSNGKSIGYIWYGDEGETLWLTSIQLKKEYQGKGLGTSLMNYLEDECRKAKKKALELGVQEINKPAREFYEKLGFEFVELLPHANSLVLRKMIS